MYGRCHQSLQTAKTSTPLKLDGKMNRNMAATFRILGIFSKLPISACMLYRHTCKIFEVLNTCISWFIDINVTEKIWLPNEKFYDIVLIIDAHRYTCEIRISNTIFKKLLAQVSKNNNKYRWQIKIHRIFSKFLMSQGTNMVPKCIHMKLSKLLMCTCIVYSHICYNLKYEQKHFTSYLHKCAKVRTNMTATWGYCPNYWCAYVS